MRSLLGAQILLFRSLRTVFESESSQHECAAQVGPARKMFLSLSDVRSFNWDMRVRSMISGRRKQATWSKQTRET